MMTIHKFPLQVTDEQEIEMPVGAVPLCVQYQNAHPGKPCLWAKVDTNAALRHVRVSTRGTGHDLEGVAGDYLGTYQMHDGYLVFHVFVGETSEGNPTIGSAAIKLKLFS